MSDVKTAVFDVKTIEHVHAVMQAHRQLMDDINYGLVVNMAIVLNQKVLGVVRDTGMGTEIVWNLEDWLGE